MSLCRNGACPRIKGKVLIEVQWWQEGRVVSAPPGATIMFCKHVAYWRTGHLERK